MVSLPGRLFSSPLGVIYISIWAACFVGYLPRVFVPSRGHLYLNLSEFTGLLFRGRFSSPLGVIYISIRTPSYYSNLKCFRPLSGSSISQYWTPLYSHWGYQFSSPLGVIYISIRRSYDNWNNGRNVFVPSRGHLYLNKIFSSLCLRMATVFVPSRGHLYLNDLATRGSRIATSFRPLSGSSISQFLESKMKGI